MHHPRTSTIRRPSLYAVFGLMMAGFASLACSGIGPQLTLTEPPEPQLTTDTGVNEGIAAGRDKLATWGDFLRSHPGAETPQAILRDCQQAAPFLHELVLRGPKTGRAAAVKAMADCGLAGNDVDESLVLAFATERRLVQVFHALQHKPSDPDRKLLMAFAPWLVNLDDKQLLELIGWIDRSSWAQDPIGVDAFAQAIEHPWPPLAAEALRRSIDRAAGIAASKHTERIQRAARSQTANLDPAVRGLARVLLAQLGPDEDDTITILQGLQDKHPTTRSYACDALAKMGDTALAFHLEQLFADKKTNEWTMRPYTRLTGDKVEGPHFRPSPRGRVDDAALGALATLTAGLGEQRFVYRDINLRYLDLDLQGAGRDARDWLRKREAQGDN